ncbi:MAG: hypothetical protein HXS54_03525 [Theionarchaea archaeon]|nr:hypothetical protein [Theionarchaea archaeon]
MKLLGQNIKNIMAETRSLMQLIYGKPIKVLFDKVLDKALDKAFDKALEYFSEESKESRKNLEEKNESQGNGG